MCWSFIVRPHRTRHTGHMMHIQIMYTRISYIYIYSQAHEPNLIISHLLSLLLLLWWHCWYMRYAPIIIQTIVWCVWLAIKLEYMNIRVCMQHAWTALPPHDVDMRLTTRWHSKCAIDAMNVRCSLPAIIYLPLVGSAPSATQMSDKSVIHLTYSQLSWYIIIFYALDSCLKCSMKESTDFGSGKQPEKTRCRRTTLARIVREAVNVFEWNIATGHAWAWCMRPTAVGWRSAAEKRYAIRWFVFHTDLTKTHSSCAVCQCEAENLSHWLITSADWRQRLRDSVGRCRCQ